MPRLAGYTDVFFAENYCSGVPVSTVNPDGSVTFGTPLTTAQLLDTALNRFRQALTAANALGAGATQTALRPLARVGIGRVLVDQGDFTAGDTTVALVLLPVALL